MRQIIIPFFLLTFSTFLHPSEEPVFSYGTSEIKKALPYTVNFQEVSMNELIRFVGRIAEVNFIYDEKQFDFKVTLTSGIGSTPQAILAAMIHLLKIHGFNAKKQEHYYLLYKTEGEISDLPESIRGASQFFTYKLQYHQGGEIEEALKKISADPSKNSKDEKLLQAIHSLQWMKTTNSFFYTTDEATSGRLQEIIQGLDTPLKQVFIEVLVIETDLRNTLDFGLDWALGGTYKQKLGFGMGNFGIDSPFAKTMQGINPSAPPTGLSQFPLGRGFDLGVIGDVITHKGQLFLSLGALVSALQADGSSTIVLNQKVIAQDNKNSKIFSGDNIPFTGSIVQTVGQGQQTSANIEYRDVGVSLSITPVLGDGEMITLDIEEEITEAIGHNATTTTSVNGIRTTKTNMATRAHVPNDHFLVISGMIRNAKRQEKTGIPCLGGLPYIGALFSRTIDHDEKKNIIIFVRPRILNTISDHEKITETQENLYKKQTNKFDFDAGLDLVR